MQRASANGGQEDVLAAVEPTAAERLDHVGKLLAEKRPWPAFLQIGAGANEEWEACPTPVQEALAWMATTTVGVLDTASVGPLVPVCQAFKALIEAAEGAAECQDKLKGLISRCAFLTTVLIQHDRAVGPLAQVQKPMKDFVATTNKLAEFAAKWTKGGKCRAFFCRRIDLKILIDFEKGLRNIRDDIALVDGLEHHQLLLAMHSDLRPQTLPDMASVPRGAISLTDAYISRPSLLGSAIGYLTSTTLGDAPCVLTGMAGGGKSVLASAVVRDEKVREHFSAGMFWWRVGRDAKDQLHEWLEGVVSRVAATSGTTPPVLGSVEEATRFLKARCAGTLSPRLVVLDDVWEREVVDALKLTGLQLLVTTRDRSVVSMPGKCVEVGDMEEDEALEVLRVGCGAPKNLELPRAQALQVVGDCGNLPLSLGLAAPLLKGPPQDPKSWRTLHEALHRAMTTRLGTDRIMTVPERVDAVLEVSLGAMADDPAKRKRCLFLAVLAPGTLAPSDMLEDLWREAPGAAKTFAAQLVDQSMLQPSGDAFRLHDLVLRFLKPKLKADPSRPIATSRIAEYLGQLKVLQRYIDAGETSDGVYSLMALWRSVESLAEESHAAAVYKRNLNGVTEDAPWRRAGRILQLMGTYEEAGQLYQRSLAICETFLGPDHPAVATALNNRAEVMKAQGKYTEAEPLYKRSQAIREEVLGPEHPGVAQSLNNRALLLASQGKYTEAEPLYERSQAIREKVLGPEHADVATTLNDRAGLFESQGKYTEAEALYKRSQTIREKVLGPEHPDVATTLSNRADVLANQGKYTEAEPLYERSQAIREKVLGPEHPHVAESLNNRAGLFASQGKYSMAEPLYKRSQTILEKVLSPEHPDVATTLNNRARLLKSQGKYTEAEPLYERSQAIREKVLGPEHPDVATTLNNRALLFAIQGKYNEAEPLYERSQTIQEKVLGPEHPDVAALLNNRAGLFANQGKYTEAEPLYERSQAIREKVLGPEHPDVATTLNNRARLCESQGKYIEAGPLYKRSQAIREKVLGPEHPAVAQSLNNQARLWETQGKYAEAEAFYERCQAIHEKALGSEHPDVATTLNNRALLFANQGKYTEADPLYERCQAIHEKTLGSEHPAVATTLNNRAGLLADQGKYTEAEALYEQSQAIHEKALGSEHPDVAITLNNRALLFASQGKYTEAEALYERCQAIHEKTLGSEHPDVATTLNNRALLLADQGKYTEAAPLYERCQAIHEKALGSEHPDVAATLNNRAQLLADQEKYTEAIPLLERALRIRKEKLGENHQDTVSTRNLLERVREKILAGVRTRCKKLAMLNAIAVTGDAMNKTGEKLLWVTPRARSNLRMFRSQTIVGAPEHLLAIQKQGRAATTYEAGKKGAARHYEEMVDNADNFQKIKIECTVGWTRGTARTLAGGIVGRK